MNRKDFFTVETRLKIQKKFKPTTITTVAAAISVLKYELKNNHQSKISIHLLHCPCNQLPLTKQYVTAASSRERGQVLKI